MHLSKVDKSACKYQTMERSSAFFQGNIFGLTQEGRKVWKEYFQNQSKYASIMKD